MHEVKKVCATAAWVVAFALMIVGTSVGEPPTRAWAILIGLLACVASGMLLLDNQRIRIEEALNRERLRVEDLVKIAARAMAEERAIPIR